MEVLSVSPHGIWLSVRGTEYLLTYSLNPWFKDAKISEIFDVHLLHEHHLWWPALDVDLHVDSLANPERFPLTSNPKIRPKRTTTR